jgi:hypothetical protein
VGHKQQAQQQPEQLQARRRREEAEERERRLALSGGGGEGVQQPTREPSYPPPSADGGPASNVQVVEGINCVWIDERNVHSCPICSSAFSFFRRKVNTRPPRHPQCMRVCTCMGVSVCTRAGSD